MTFEVWWITYYGHIRKVLDPKLYDQIKYACRLAWNAGARSGNIFENDESQETA